MLKLSAALAMLLGGAVAYLVARQPPQDTPASATVALSAAPRTTTVKLVVLPRDVDAEVDGARARVVSGAVDIAGPIGSVHRVRLRLAGQESLHDVVVTEQGPLPVLIELSAPAASAPAEGPANAERRPTPAASPPPARVVPGPRTSVPAAPQASGESIWFKR
jgi:serine/threonine-protein kinase